MSELPSSDAAKVVDSFETRCQLCDFLDRVICRTSVMRIGRLVEMVNRVLMPML